jgi:hypothetical protein
MTSENDARNGCWRGQATWEIADIVDLLEAWEAVN